MKNRSIASGITHTLNSGLKDMLSVTPGAYITWKNITPLARNEWICWIESAKKKETTSRRIIIARENLSAGKRRPCCWAGCPHR